MPVFDLHTLIVVIAVAFGGGIVGLDRTAVGQLMLSQPIVVGPLTGWFLGDATAGMIVGAALELLWVLDMPVGTFVPADATIGAIAGTAIAVLGSGGRAGLDLVGFGILLTAGMVPLTMIVDGVVRKRNSRLVDEALSSTGENADHKLTCAHLKGLTFFFLKSFLLHLIFIPAGLLAVLLFTRMSAPFHDAMELFVKLLPLLGAAVVARKLSIETLDRFFLFGFILAAVMALLFHAPAGIIVLSVIAAGYFSALYRERHT